MYTLNELPGTLDVFTMFGALGEGVGTDELYSKPYPTQATIRWSAYRNNVLFILQI